MWQVLRLIMTLEEGSYDGAYRARICRAVGVATRLAVDRAYVEAGAAADAVQCLLELSTEQSGATVVHEDEVELLGPVELPPLPGSRYEVGVHRKLLPRAATREEPDEDREVRKSRDEFLYTHHDHVNWRDARYEPGVALVRYRGDCPRFGDAEVGAGYAYIRGQEFLAQASTGEGAKGLYVGRQLFARCAGEDLRYALAVHVQDGTDDVRGRIPGELCDPLPQVRLDDLEASVVLLQTPVQLDLLRCHALGLGDDLRALLLREVPNVADHVLTIGREEDVAAACLDGGGHLPQVAVQVGHRLLLDAVGLLPQFGCLGQSLEDGVAPGHGFVGEELYRVVQLLVSDGPARPFVETLYTAAEALPAVVFRLALAGRLPGLHVLNQPFRRRVPVRGGGRGCRARCAAGALRGASGSWSRPRSGCPPHSSPGL